MKASVKKTLSMAREGFKKLISKRNDLGYSQREVADEMETVKHFVGKLEQQVEKNKLDNMTLMSMARYADAVGCKVQIRVVKK